MRRDCWEKWRIILYYTTIASRFASVYYLDFIYFCFVMQKLTPWQKMNESYINLKDKSIQYEQNKNGSLILLEDTQEEIEKMDLWDLKDYIKELVRIIIH